MQKVNVITFYFIGKVLAPWGNTHKGTTYGSLLVGTVAARGFLDLLIGQGVLPIKATEEAARDLKAAIDAAMPPDLNDVQDRFNQVVPLVALNDVQAALTRLETTLSREPGFSHIYSVSPKGIMDIDSLVEAGEAGVGKQAKNLPPLAVCDFRHAGRCLAFDLPTAAAFHSLRAGETIIKVYYKKLAGEEWDDKHKESQRNWGQYIKALEEAGAKPIIVAALKQIKDLYRNPIVHPEAQLDTDEAIGLFGQVQGVVSLMLKEIHGVA